MSNETKIIPLKMTWTSLVRGMLAVMQNPEATTKSHREIVAEFERMAKQADCYLKVLDVVNEGGAS